MKKNKTIFLFVLFSTVMLGYSSMFAASNGDDRSRKSVNCISADYRTIQSGNWNSKSTWQVYTWKLFGGWNWYNASNPPDYNNGLITILNSHTVTVTTGVTVDQVTIDAGGTVVVNNGITLTLHNGNCTDLKVNGTLSIQGTGSLVLNSGASLAYGAAGTLVYTGSNAKTTGAELLSTVPNLTIDNSADVALSSTVKVKGSLSFTNGKLNTGADSVILGRHATISEAVGTYLVGKLTTGSRTVGSGGSSFGGIGVRLAAGVDVGNVRVTRVSGTYGIVSANGNEGIARKWTITTSVAPSSDINLTLRWVSDDNNSVDLTNAQVFKSYNGSEPWSAVGSAQDVDPEDSITVPVSSFSVFTVGDAANPLPVELTSFSAAVNNDVVSLTWVTKTEKNNYGFSVERRVKPTTMGKNEEWENIGFVNGYGNSNSPKNYSFRDKASNGTFSYRLKQINTDGSYEYSESIAVEVNAKPMKYDIANYPNPFNPETKIQFELPQASHVNLTIYNIAGEKVVTLVDETMEAGVYQKTFSSNSYYGQLSSGIYFFRLTTDNGINITKKMVLAK